MVLEGAGRHESRWAAIVSISSKIGCAPQTLNEWVKKVEVDTGHRSGITTEQAEKMLPELPNQIPLGQDIGSVTADGAHDTQKCHDAIAARNAHAVIPP